MHKGFRFGSPFFNWRKTDFSPIMRFSLVYERVMCNMMKAIRKSNKGFTLVELIIVVAIIAVLAAVLAPRYMQYVERSRESNDLQIATNYMRAATVAMADRGTSVHTEKFDWYIFKWGYSTGPLGTDLMNMHIGAAIVDSNNRPTGIDNNNRDPVMQNEMAEIMGWTDATGAPSTDFIDRPESASVQNQSFMFYINSRTGEILVHEDSANWVNVVGVNAPLQT